MYKLIVIPNGEYKYFIIQVNTTFITSFIALYNLLNLKFNKMCNYL